MVRLFDSECEASLFRSSERDCSGRRKRTQRERLGGGSSGDGSDENMKGEALTSTPARVANRLTRSQSR
jgi:hypothetical protein